MIGENKLISACSPVSEHLAKHEKICVSLDKQSISRLNFLVKSGPQNSIVIHQSYVDFNERFVI